MLHVWGSLLLLFFSLILITTNGSVSVVETNHSAMKKLRTSDPMVVTALIEPLVAGNSDRPAQQSRRWPLVRVYDAMYLHLVGEPTA